MSMDTADQYLHWKLEYDDHNIAWLHLDMADSKVNLLAGSDAPIPAQTLGRLSVSRCLGYRGVGFALSVATYRGWLR